MWNPKTHPPKLFYIRLPNNPYVSCDKEWWNEGIARRVVRTIDVSVNPPVVTERTPPPPPPKYTKGDWFVHSGDPTATFMIVDEPFYDGGAWRYKVRGVRADVDNWPADSAVDRGGHLPIPPKPTKLPTDKELTGECRDWKPWDEWVDRDGFVRTYDYSPVCRQDWGTRVWIVRDVKLCVEPWVREAAIEWAGDNRTAHKLASHIARAYAGREKGEKE